MEMTDSDKTIDGFAYWIDNEENGVCYIPLNLCEKIMELLKEQQPMKPIYSEEKFGDHLPHCPACKKVLPSIPEYGKSNFCHRCGQAVKWE